MGTMTVFPDSLLMILFIRIFLPTLICVPIAAILLEKNPCPTHGTEAERIKSTIEIGPWHGSNCLMIRSGDQRDRPAACLLCSLVSSIRPNFYFFWRFWRLAKEPFPPHDTSDQGLSLTITSRCVYDPHVVGIKRRREVGLWNRQ